MGVDYYSYAVIGVKIDTRKLYVERPIKAFPHDYPESMKFDPQTGKPLWHIEGVPAEGIEDRRGDFYAAGYRVVFGTDRRTAYIALTYSESPGRPTSGPFEPLIAFDLGSAAKEMRDKLEPLGFWTASAFGLWAVLYCSY